MDVLDRHLLLALAALAIESFEQRGVCPRQLVRLDEIFVPARERLLGEHGAAVAFH